MTERDGDGLDASLWETYVRRGQSRWQILHAVSREGCAHIMPRRALLLGRPNPGRVAPPLPLDRDEQRRYEAAMTDPEKDDSSRASDAGREKWEKLLKENFAGWSTKVPENVRNQYPSRGGYFFDLGACLAGFDAYEKSAQEALKNDLVFDLSLVELLAWKESDAGDMAYTADRCHVRIVLENGGAVPEFDCLHTAVWRRDGERWRIAHEHQSRQETVP
jgi:ketosteroid isomerase-like protein